MSNLQWHSLWMPRLPQKYVFFLFSCSYDMIAGINLLLLPALEVLRLQEHSFRGSISCPTLQNLNITCNPCICKLADRVTAAANLFERMDGLRKVHMQLQDPTLQVRSFCLSTILYYAGTRSFIKCCTKYRNTWLCWVWLVWLDSIADIGLDVILSKKFAACSVTVSNWFGMTLHML